MGGPIILVVALAGLAVVSLIFIIYACHCFLHVLSDSSAGIDEVRWPSENISEWWWKPFYCLGLLAFWAITCGIVVGPFFVASPDGFWIAYPLALWLVYPLSVSSPLAANNLLMILYPPFLGSVARHPWALLLVTIASLPLAAAAVTLVGLLVVQGRLSWALGAAVVLPAALLFYARAWGRLAWFVLNEDRPDRKKRRITATRSPALTVEDPWHTPEPEVPELDVEVLPEEPPAPPEEIEDEWSPHKKPYPLLDEKKARQEWKQRRRILEPLEEGYDLTHGEPPPLPDEAEKYRKLAEIEQGRKAREQGMTPREWAQEKKPPTFKRALGRGLFLFLFYPRTLQAWLNLSLLTFFELLFVHLVISFASTL